MLKWNSTKEIALARAESSGLAKEITICLTDEAGLSALLTQNLFSRMISQAG